MHHCGATCASPAQPPCSPAPLASAAPCLRFAQALALVQDCLYLLAGFCAAGYESLHRVLVLVLELHIAKAITQHHFWATLLRAALREACK
jgi:hypothetical protein